MVLLLYYLVREFLVKLQKFWKSLFQYEKSVKSREKIFGWISFRGQICSIYLWCKHLERALLFYSPSYGRFL